MILWALNITFTHLIVSEYNRFIKKLHSEHNHSSVIVQTAYINLELHNANINIKISMQIKCMRLFFRRSCAFGKCHRSHCWKVVPC